MKKYTFSTLLLAALYVSTAAVAQTNGSNSPYSRYGFGLLADGAGGFNKAMGGAGLALHDGKELNFRNPAAYSAIDSLTFIFDIGASLQNANLKQGALSTNARNTSIDYVNLGFRLSPNFGMAVGLVPYSTIGYAMKGQDTFDQTTGTVTQTDQYAGNGGLHEAYAGVGWRPFKPVSLGVNAGYLWGEMSHTVTASFSQSNIDSRKRQYGGEVRSYKIDAGMQFYIPLHKKHELTLGLTYGLGHGLGSKAYFYDQKITGSSITSGDTLVLRDAYAMPHSFGTGIAWNYNNRLRIAADYTIQKWGSLKFPTVETHGGMLALADRKGAYKDMHRISAGIDFINKPDGFRWGDFIRYRAGFSYTSSYTLVDGHDGPTSYLVSAGVGLPVINRHNNRSLVNVAIQYERVKPKAAGMITENYLRLCLGITFNERWFMKWKVD
ncbi:MAG: hypothetical protein J1F06_01185 [Prevotellaceae bacterium]|nr:hypothetical protein [Prevotellaceae bacterium]